MIFESLASADRARGDSRRSWPLEAFDLSHEPEVILVEEFERSFGCSARFSFKRNPEHGEQLRLILHRLERYRCGHSPPALWLLRRCIQVAGGAYADGHVQSLAYFLPLFRELAKMRRRKYRAYWGLGEASIEGLPAWL